MENADGFKGSFCPYLGTINARSENSPPIEYPSFENRCQATGEEEPPLLTDQATFCLCKGYQLCDRYQAAVAFEDLDDATASPHAAVGVTLDSDRLTNGLDDLSDLSATTPPSRRSKALWGWLGAGLIFLTVVSCGSIAAIYAGWTLANARLARPAGSVNTLAQPVNTPLPVYVIMTATSPPDAPAPATATSVQEFPPAVTPTQAQGGSSTTGGTPVAGRIDGTVGRGAPPVVVAIPPSPTLATDNAASQSALPNLSAAVPTRRDTPDPALLQVPASTPLTATPTPPASTATPLPTATLGQAVVLFGPESDALKSGKCTMVLWNVENVREVYYENLPVNGHGEKEECIDDEDEVYTLTVILTNGEPRIYTTTVTLLEPTPTATPTRTFTPVPQFTPTWTPIPPTDTPVPATNTPSPVYEYGVLLAAADGTSQSCAVGSTCVVGLLATNTGTTIDGFTINFIQRDAWPSQLCRQDGVCSSERLSLVNVGQANTAYITLKVEIPSDAPVNGESVTYSMQAISEGSGGAAASDVLAIGITAE